MILKIRNSIFAKLFSVSMIWVMAFTLVVPINSFSLTGGPAQPEFNSFTPIGTSDMVDLSSGDFTYNIPLMDVGGFPINLAYSSGITMDQEASWVGLGWDLGIGQINRQMRGLPDDFDGDTMTYIDNMKDNWTVEGTMKVTPATVGVDKFGNKILVDNPISQNNGPTVGVAIGYNSYNGFYMKSSVSLQASLGGMFSVGLQAESGPDGMALSPSASISGKLGVKKKAITNLSGNVGAAFNSRQGLSNVNLSASQSGFTTKVKDRKNANVKKDVSGVGAASTGSSISFMPNHHTPTVTSNQVNESLTLNLALGAEVTGIEVNGMVRAYYNRQYVPDDKKVKLVKAAGYDNNHKADKTYARDFNREKDAAISVNSTNLPLTSYTYDIYSISGQGVSGTFRPYRSQIGYVADAFAQSKVNSLSTGVELGIGNLVHNGIDVETTWGKSTLSNWNEKFFDEDYQNDVMPSFESNTTSNSLYEEVYFRNVGDLSTDADQGLLDNVKPMRINIIGDKYKRELEASYISKDGSSNGIGTAVKRSVRRKRNQTILKVSAGEVTTDQGTLLGFNKNTLAKNHHTAGFIVTRNDGARYIYGEALYNIQKQEVAFSMGGMTSNTTDGLITYSPGVDDSHEDNKNGDHFFNKIITPAFAHTFLLTSLVSTDYSDLSGDGLSDDDLGSWTKFEYKKSPGNYQWRVPFQKNKARYSEGLKTELDDDRGSYVYGEKEVKYIDKIETKTHIAVFHTADREDGFGVDDSTGGVDFASTTSKMQKLESIELFSKGEYFNSDGSVNSQAIPIKTVHFEYSYKLCRGIPNSQNAGTSVENGKLTLEKVYFTYRASKLGAYSPYVFTYGDIDHDGVQSADENPNYSLTDYDIWGSYKKPESGAGNENLDAPLVPEFNYVNQQENQIDLNHSAAAWSMSSIVLPSSSTIEIDYEADDYAYVQNEKAMEMFKVTGAGHEPGSNGTNPDKRELFKLDVSPKPDPNEASYFYIELPQNDNDITTSSQADNNLNFYNKYIKDIKKKFDGLVQFRFFVNMGLKGGKNSPSNSDLNKGSFDYVNGYFELNKEIGLSDNAQIIQNYTVFSSNNKLYGSIPVQLVDIGSTFDGNFQAQVNPVSKAGWQFGRKYLSNYIYDAGGANTNAPDGGEAVKAVMSQVIQVFQNLTEIFTGPNRLLRSKKIARRFLPKRSWIRLMSPSGNKKGGGVRVAEIRMSDEWGKMTTSEGQVNGSHIKVFPNTEDRTQSYGQEYTYKTINEHGDTISSGVATYEPVGAKDNPLIQPRFVHINRVLGPDDENFMETPFGESFFPSPKVTYSKVEVKNLERKKDVTGDGVDDMVATHATGKVVTEFYTSRDFPTICDQTDLQIEEDGGKKSDQLIQNLLKIKIRKHIAVSQGYTVRTNDMDGKMKKQLVYAEGKDIPISGALYRYKGQGFSYGDLPTDLTTTNSGRLKHRVQTITPDGNRSTRTVGVEVDVINDFREMYSIARTAGIHGNLASFTIGPLPLILPVGLPSFSQNENRVNIAVTTKVINTFGVLEETIAFDNGASVSTKNLCWDSETGDVILTETSNEFSDKYYSFNYPAHWYYKGMGLASFNSGATMKISKIGSTEYYHLATNAANTDIILFEGDEVIFTHITSAIPAVISRTKLWITELDIANEKFILKDKDGLVWTEDSGSIRIIRSGKRNLQTTSMGSMVSQKNPLEVIDAAPGNAINATFFDFDEASIYDFKVINAGAVEFQKEWDGCVQLPEGPTNNSSSQVNEYALNLKGIYRAATSYLYLTKRYANKNDIGITDDGNTNTDNEVDTRNEGFYGSFSPFYQNTAGGWVVSQNGWTYTSTVTKYSPFGFELENQDALGRYSSAQYGYNNMFPMAVGANSEYSKIGFDGFEDYDFSSVFNGHFNFIHELLGQSAVTEAKSHTGKHSLKIPAGNSVQKNISID